MGSKRVAGPRPKTERETWPQYDELPLREIKKRKRREAFEAQQALERLHYGSSHLPPIDGVHVGGMLSQIKRARREWSNWWRNA
jgi:hypothetical protein